MPYLSQLEWKAPLKHVCEANNLSVSQTDDIFSTVRRVVETVRATDLLAFKALVEGMKVDEKDFSRARKLLNGGYNQALSDVVHALSKLTETP